MQWHVCSRCRDIRVSDRDLAIAHRWKTVGEGGEKHWLHRLVSLFR